MMQDDKNASEESKSPSTMGNEFDMNKLDEKAESEPGFFHVTTKYKWVLALSILMLLAEGIMIYAFVEGALAAEIWQVALWGVGALVAVYSIVSKSLAATIFNMILFLGISMIPAWGTAYEFFRPVIELFTGKAP